MAKQYSNLPFGTAGGGRFQEAVDISVTDYTCPVASQARIRGIYFSGPAGTGVVVGRLVDDDVDSTWTLASQYLHGLAFTIIRQAGTTATGIRLIG